MTKELFVKCINTIREHRKKEEKFVDALNTLSPDTYNETFLFDKYEYAPWLYVSMPLAAAACAARMISEVLVPV